MATNSVDSGHNKRVVEVDGTLQVNYKWISDNSHRFTEWYDKQTYPVQSANLLAKYCSEHFHTWFDSTTYPYEPWILNLIAYCPQYFTDWWDLSQMSHIHLTNSPSVQEYLEKHCSEYIHIWGPCILYN